MVSKIVVGILNNYAMLNITFVSLLAGVRNVMINRKAPYTHSARTFHSSTFDLISIFFDKSRTMTDFTNRYPNYYLNASLDRMICFSGWARQ